MQRHLHCSRPSERLSRVGPCVFIRLNLPTGPEGEYLPRPGPKRVQEPSQRPGEDTRSRAGPVNVADSEASYGRGTFHLPPSTQPPLCQPTLGASSQQGGRTKTRELCLQVGHRIHSLLGRAGSHWTTQGSSRRSLEKQPGPGAFTTKENLRPESPSQGRKSSNPSISLTDSGLAKE